VLCDLGDGWCRKGMLCCCELAKLVMVKRVKKRACRDETDARGGSVLLFAAACHTRLSHCVSCIVGRNGLWGGYRAIHWCH
jgi:hypothetical protein